MYCRRPPPGREVAILGAPPYPELLRLHVLLPRSCCPDLRDPGPFGNARRPVCISYRVVLVLV